MKSSNFNNENWVFQFFLCVTPILHKQFYFRVIGVIYQTYMDSGLGLLSIKVAKTFPSITFQLLFLRSILFWFSLVIVKLKIITPVSIVSVIISCLPVHRVKYLKFKFYSMLRYFLITFFLSTEMAIHKHYTDCVCPLYTLLEIRS